MRERESADKNSGRQSGTLFLFSAIVAGILGILSASPIGQIIYVFSMISVIGIPIAVLVAAIPTIALLIVPGYLIWRFVPPFRNWNAAVSIAAAGMLLLIIPVAHNAEIKAKVADLISNDTGHPAGPGLLPLGADQTLALISARGRSSLCDQICLHLLMSGGAARVLAVPLKADQAAPDPAMRAYSYHLDRRTTCPAPGNRSTGAQTHARHFREKTPGTISGRYAAMLEQGYCLVAAEATLRDADLAFMVLDRGDFPVPSTLSPIAADTIVNRAGVYARSAQGELARLWQQTSVSYSLLGPVLMPRINVPAGLSGASTGWWRDRFETGKPAFTTLPTLIRAVGIGLPAELR